MKIAFLGLGNMGAPLANLLLQARHDVTVWNRTPGKAEALTGSGAILARNPYEAVSEAEAVFTMLNDDTAVEQVVLGSSGNPGILPHLAQGAVHLSLSTISVQLSRRLTSEHEHAGKEFVASPVFGRPNVAAEGKLWIVTAGKPASVREGQAPA